MLNALRSCPEYVLDASLARYLAPLEFPDQERDGMEAMQALPRMPEWRDVDRETFLDEISPRRGPAVLRE